jgi:hypothetical protein
MDKLYRPIVEGGFTVGNGMVGATTVGEAVGAFSYKIIISPINNKHFVHTILLRKKFIIPMSKSNRVCQDFILISYNKTPTRTGGELGIVGIYEKMNFTDASKSRKTLYKIVT